MTQRTMDTVAKILVRGILHAGLTEGQAVLMIETVKLVLHCVVDGFGNGSAYKFHDAVASEWAAQLQLQGKKG